MVTSVTSRHQTLRAERRATVMGTDAHVIVVADDADYLADTALARLRELEARWSRFLPDSEVSRLNACPGLPVLVSHVTFQLIDHALTAWNMTDGAFDPTVLTALCAQGYDRSFELLDRSEASEPSAQERVTEAAQDLACRGAPDIHLDRVVGTVRLGAATGFDPGGIGKGFAADLIVGELLSSGARGVLVSVGGDLRVAGEPPTGESWGVAITDPLDPGRVIGNLSIEAGAVASSWRTKRTWIGPDGRSHHHLIDPRTGRSAATGVAGVTVVAAQGWRAEVLAKAALIAGPEAGLELLAQAGAAGIVMTDDGAVLEAGNIAAFLMPTYSTQER